MKVIKRLFDVIFSLIFIVLCLPLLIVIAIAIKLDSPGPILYYRKFDGSPVYRVGAQGKIFRYFKFRSMEHGNRGKEEEITRVGKIIRPWHLDELPELFLVLLGKMSLVGPRHCTMEQYFNYPSELFEGWTVKPGMTGPSQLKGKFFPIKERVASDLAYIKNWSLASDFKLILVTPFVIFQKRKDPHFK